MQIYIYIIYTNIIYLTNDKYNKYNIFVISKKLLIIFIGL